MAIDRTEIALLVGPFIPDRDTVLVQIGNVGVTLEKPEQFVNHGFGVDLLGRDERKAL